MSVPTTHAPVLFSPISEYDGKIREILLMELSLKPRNLASVIKSFAGIIKAFDKDVKVTILVALGGLPESPISEMTAHFEELLAESLGMGDGGKWQAEHLNLLAIDEFLDLHRETQARQPKGVIPVPEGRATLFPRDLIYPFHSKDRELNSFMVSFNQSYNLKNQFAPAALMNARKCWLRPTFLYLEGGNALTGRDYIVMGRDILAQNQEIYQAKASEIEANVQREFGYRPIWSGTFEALSAPNLRLSQGKFQPAFHLDMYLTLAGAITEDGEEKELVFVGQLVGDASKEAEIPNNPRSILLWQINDALERCAQDFELRRVNGRAFKVVRLPLMLVIQGASGRFLSYNNCLMEIYGDTKRVYLPSYLDDPLDGVDMTEFERQAVCEYEAQGFEVTKVEARLASKSWVTQGSLHCLVQILARDINPD